MVMFSKQAALRESRDMWGFCRITGVPGCGRGRLDVHAASKAACKLGSRTATYPFSCYGSFLESSVWDLEF